jgi:hypothetical protein
MGFGSGGSGSSIASSADVTLNNPINGNVLTYNGETSKWLNGLPTGGSGTDTSHILVNLQNAAYTLVMEDDSKAIEINSTAAVNVTVPSSASVDFPIGTVIEICQVGTGQAVLVAGGGVTLRSPSSFATKQRWSTMGLRKRATDEWIVSGDLA